MRLCFFLLFVAVQSCQTNSSRHSIATHKLSPRPVHHRIAGQKTIHVFVALCDNTYQGIVPVPKKIGNGQDAANNLYWGCSYGIKSFFSNSKEWELQAPSISNIENPILERCIFKHRFSNTWLVADAWDGQYIKPCTEAFFTACAGGSSDSVILKNGNIIVTLGSADLLVYIGHNGLMDFKINHTFPATDTLPRAAIMLACISKSYFAPLLQHTAAQPILWSTGLMAPEAYVLHDALSAWIKKQPPETIRSQAAAAYSKYQKCSVKAATNLLVTGW